MRDFLMRGSARTSSMYVWTEQSLFEIHDLDQTKKYVANVVYLEMLQDKNSDR